MSIGVAILYVYGVVCVSMLLFNLLYNLFQRTRERIVARRTANIEDRIELQIDRLENGGKIDYKHLLYLEKKLVKVNELVAFDRALEELEIFKGSEPVEKYRLQVQSLIIGLAGVYQHRENMQAAYYAYVLSRHYRKSNTNVHRAEDAMVAYMERDNLYCRLNALNALFEFGSPERVAEMVAYQDRAGSFFHEKLLTDGLLTFQGDHDKLITELWTRFPQLSNKSKLAVLNYIRFKTGDYINQMRAIMEDPGQDKELRLSAMRYFGKYIYEPVKDCLLAFASDRDPLKWEYAAVAETCLAGYPGDDVTEVLMDSVHSSNWYVRLNAATSLESRGLAYTDLLDVMGGGDRYAREMVMYRLDERRIKQELQKPEETTV